MTPDWLIWSNKSSVLFVTNMQWKTFCNKK